MLVMVLFVSLGPVAVPLSLNVMTFGFDSLGPLRLIPNDFGASLICLVVPPLGQNVLFFHSFHQDKINCPKAD